MASQGIRFGSVAATNPPGQAPPPPKRVRIDFGDEVTVLVGVPEQRFVCHINLLTAHSPFFEAALSGKWRESKEKVIRLPEQDPTAFSIYLNWRYTGDVDLWDGQEDTTTRIDQKGVTWAVAGDRFHRVVRCSALADMLQEPGFSNALIDSYFNLVDTTSTCPGAGVVNLAFQLLAETAGMRRLLVRQLAYNWAPEDVNQVMGQYEPQVWKAIATLSIIEQKLAWKDKGTRAMRQTFYHALPKDEKK